MGLNLSAYQTTTSEILQHVRVTELECALIEVASGHGAKFVAMRPTFHFVLNGNCHLVAEDGSCSASLKSGDFVVVPHGRRHALSSSLGGAAVTAQQAERINPPLARDVPVMLRFGSSAAPAFRILSGVFQFPALTAKPIVSTLPLLLRSQQDGPLTLFGDELATSVMAPGGRAVVLRMADLMILEAIRGAPEIMAQIADLGPVWLKTFRIEQAVAAMTDNPAHPWTLASLSKYVGMSRASFADKYLIRMGLPPIQHLTNIRLDHAASLLRSTALPIGEIAHQSGYASESSFTRAFRKRHGVPPKDFRRIAWIQPIN